MERKKGTGYNKIMETSEGKRLYCYWQRIKKKGVSAEFAAFVDFYRWTKKSGYVLGAKLVRHYEFEPYSPENCFWMPPKEEEEAEEKNCRNYTREQEWDEVINRIRLHFGMEPIYSSGV